MCKGKSRRNFYTFDEIMISASAIKRLSPSIISMKSKGDKGQPCLIPREALKNFEGVPLIRIEKFAKVRHPII